MYCDELDASAGCLSIRCRYNAVHAASEQFNSRIPSDTAKARGLHTVALTRLVRIGTSAIPIYSVHFSKRLTDCTGSGVSVHAASRDNGTRVAVTVLDAKGTTSSLKLRNGDGRERLVSP
jgi:hypothetical protein